jgi:hypothetical protein
MSRAKSEEIKVRVPDGFKSAVLKIAHQRFTSESEIVREALLEYLRARNIDPFILRDDGAPAPELTPEQEAQKDAAALARSIAGAEPQPLYKRRRRRNPAAPKSPSPTAVHPAPDNPPHT